MLRPDVKHTTSGTAIDHIEQFGTQGRQTMKTQADKFKAPRTRLYTVRVGFLNANADYNTSVLATNPWNAVWRVSCSLMNKKSQGIVTHVNGKDVMELR